MGYPSFQIKQIPATNQHFSRNNNPVSIKFTVSQSQFSKKKFFFPIWNLQTMQTDRDLFCHYKNTSKLNKTDYWHCRHIKFWVIYSFSKWAKKWQTKYGDLMLPGTFLDKMTRDINFTDEAVVQCDVPVVKILL